MIVGNKADVSPVDVDIAQLKKHHGRIAAYHKLSCLTANAEGRSAFQAFLVQFKEELVKLAGMGSMVKEHAEAMADIDHLLRLRGRVPVADLIEIFTRKGVDPQIARDQIAYLDLLGVAVWFKDLPALEHMVFSPAWITSSVYSVLYSRIAHVRGGRLTEAEFHMVLDSANRGYDAEDKRLIMDAMRAFKTAFVKRGRWLLPAILPVAAVKHRFDTMGPLSVRLRFEAFLPPQLISQLICVRQREIVEDAVWRSGVHLRALGGLKAEALLRADHARGTLRIDVTGDDAQVYLSILLDATFDAMAELPDLRPEVELRLDPGAAIVDRSDDAPAAEDWIALQTVLLASSRKMTEFLHRNHVYSTELALGVAPIPPELRRGDVFLSYARSDLTLLMELDRRLYYADVSTWWDRRGIGKGEWKQQVETAIDRAKALIVLWTPNSAGREQVEYEVDRFAEKHGHAEVIHLITEGIDVDTNLPKYKHLNMHVYKCRQGFENIEDVRRLLAGRGVSMR